MKKPSLNSEGFIFAKSIYLSAKSRATLYQIPPDIMRVESNETLTSMIFGNTDPSLAVGIAFGVRVGNKYFFPCASETKNCDIIFSYPPLPKGYINEF